MFTILHVDDRDDNAHVTAGQTAATPDHEETMARINEGIKRQGDLPIFSATINKIRRLSSDPDSDAMSVAKEVLQDANLSTKLLCLSNSAYYKRGVGKISVISRAVVNTMAPPSPSKMATPLKDRVSFNSSITSLAHQLLENLYTDTGDNNQLTDTLEMISKTTRLDDGMVENYLNESFRMSCNLATEYGLSKKLLQPTLGSGEGTLRNKWARQFSYFASLDDNSDDIDPVITTDTIENTEVSPGMSLSNQALVVNAAAPQTIDVEFQEQSDTKSIELQQHSIQNEVFATRADPQLQLHIIQQITELMTNSARLSEVFVKVVDGLNCGAGFDRVLLCLVTPDRRHYVARLAAGDDCDALKQYFSFPINPSRDIFSKVLMEGGELLVKDATEAQYRNLLPADFVETIKVNSFGIAALHYQGKAVGFFYVDCAVTMRSIDDTDQRNLLQFVTQARLALRLCNWSRIRPRTVFINYN